MVFYSEILSAIRVNRVREKRYRLWKGSLSSYHHQNYKLARNRVVSLIRQAKNVFFKDKLDPSLPSKLFWRNVRNLGLGRCKRSCNNMFGPDEINRYFVGSNSSANLSVDLMVNESSNSFAFANICEDDLFSAICQVKSESSGLDNISIKFVKRVFPYVSKYLLHIFNYILTTSSYPNQWRLSKVVPIPKVSNPSDLSHFLL